MKLPAKNGEMWMGDCLELMSDVPSGSVDMILCDLPYGTTQNKWDSVIPFEPLWEHYWRICRGAVVLTAAQPFTSALVMSCPDRFRYEWIWRKQHTGQLNAKRMPLKNIENVLVFARESGTYNPQMTAGGAYTVRRKGYVGNDSYGAQKDHDTVSDGMRHPMQIINLPVRDADAWHPTQKPVALFEYLIRTYTNPGDVVMDNCLGSGTTAVAAENTGRRWIGIERDEEYFIKAWTRVMGL